MAALVGEAGRAVPETAVKELGSALEGSLLAAGDAGYDEARRLWNGMIDRRPGLIARCAGPDDVVRAVNFGRDHGLLVAVRGGGHSMPGLSVCDGGLMIDLSPMKGITVDPGRATARAECGLLWGEFDSATQAHGLATTGGQVSHTGIAGLTLGSGLGWLMRNFGLTPDNVLSVDLVTADGRSVVASAAENADLFWGLRGGGGNFGVATSIEYQLLPLGAVLGGMTAYPQTLAPSVVAGWRDYVAAAPDELTTGCLFLTTPDGHPAVGVAQCWSGEVGPAGEEATAPLRRLGPVAMDQFGPMPYLAMQQLVDPAVVPGNRYYQRASYLADVSDELIGVLADRYRQAASPMSVILLLHFGGAVGRVAPDAMAFPHRRELYYVDVMSVWTEPAGDDANIGWLKDTWSAMAPFISGGVDVNHIDRGEDRVRDAYGPANYERLVALKRRYDPENLFRLNQNIRP